jgi:hypothetical protein
MEGQLLRIFQGELETQCEFIVMGAGQVDASLQTSNPMNFTAVWFGLQGILVSAANASKLLWGSRVRVREERRTLRHSVEVTDNSPLNSRRLRNDFEHFDERIEEWFATSKNHNYFGRSIGRNAIFVEGAPPTDAFGNFDPPTATVTFWERSASLKEVVEEAQRILGLFETLKYSWPRSATPP